MVRLAGFTFNDSASSILVRESMDVLSDVLATLRLESTVFAHGELAKPWGIRTEPHEDFSFHIVASGECWLQVDDLSPKKLGAGDVVIVSRHHGHAVRDDMKTRALPLREFLTTGGFASRAAPSGTGTKLVCGCFSLEGLPDDPLIASLPPVMHARALVSEVGWLGETVKLLDRESSSLEPGAQTVVNRLCDALFVYVLRRLLAELPRDEKSWLAALVDPHVAPVLRSIHEKPAEPWTVADLASQAGMSRSSFAAHFAKVVGEAPIEYLIRWRLRKAAGMLRMGTAGIAEIAANVGYDSEAAFSKAFKRSIGVTPGAFRRGASENRAA
jgi:AraC-like DNA-binding protein